MGANRLLGKITKVGSTEANPDLGFTSYLAPGMSKHL